MLAPLGTRHLAEMVAEHKLPVNLDVKDIFLKYRTSFSVPRVNDSEQEVDIYVSMFR